MLLQPFRKSGLSDDVYQRLDLEDEDWILIEDSRRDIHISMKMWDKNPGRDAFDPSSRSNSRTATFYHPETTSTTLANMHCIVKKTKRPAKNCFRRARGHGFQVASIKPRVMGHF
jgi:hypothetical protein